MGNFDVVDTMIKDGFPWDAFNGYYMGNTAENVVRHHGRSTWGAAG